MKEKTLKQVCQTAADIFGLDAAVLNADSSPETVSNWDSMQQLNLVLAMEETFALQFSPEEIETMKTLGAIANLVDSKL